LQRSPGERVKRRGRAPRTAGRFVEVRLASASPTPTYEVVLAHGRSIRVPSQFDPQGLSRLIAAVESC
jgi:predicted phage tail protein